MITFAVEYQPPCLVPGATVTGVLIMNLDAPHAISSVDLQIVCEEVTRRVKKQGKSRRIKTDRTYLLHFSNPAFNSSEPAGQAFEPGSYKYPFVFEIPQNLPGSISGPNLDYFWAEKQKYEINYWFEASAQEKIPGWLGSSSVKCENKKFPFAVYETPFLENHAAHLRQVPWHTSGALEVSQGCFGDPGEISFTFSAPKQYTTAGDRFPVTVELENKCKKPITMLTISLEQVLDYNVTSHFKHKTLLLEQKNFTTNIQPGTSLPVDAGINIPVAIPASTPSVFLRKINVGYKFAVAVTVGSGHNVQLIDERILISNLPFLA